MFNKQMGSLNISYCPLKGIHLSWVRLLKSRVKVQSFKKNSNVKTCINAFEILIFSRLNGQLCLDKLKLNQIGNYNLPDQVFWG